jgi:hypothetical protein
MRVGHLDAFSGVAGDMWVAAALDAGADFQALEQAVRSLGLEGVRIERRSVRRGGFAATQFLVHVARHGKGHHGHGHHARHLPEVQAILERAAVPPVVRDSARKAFLSLAAAEAEVHGVPAAEVHFHEVGAEDAIVDVLCACLATHGLGIERLTCSVVVTGKGTIQCEHGTLPVPAPGTQRLLQGIPMRSGAIDGEFLTPTGAALLKTLVAEYEPETTFVPQRTGYGAGARDVEARPNLLRLTVGERTGHAAAGELLEICCNLDTATGEQVAFVVDRLLQLGVADAFVTPVLMKKGRPGHLVTVLAGDAHRDAVVRLLLEESTTLGLRMHRVQREVLERWIETVRTPLGEVRMKCARLPSGQVARRPEDDEVLRLVRESGLSRHEVLRRIAEG